MEKLTRNLIIGGVALAVIGVSAYFIFKPKEKSKDKVPDKKETITTITVDKNIISQKEADFIMDKINKTYKDSIEKYGALVPFLNSIKNALVEELGKGGYKIVDGKAVKK
jgi:hypothetical protein